MKLKSFLLAAILAFILPASLASAQLTDEDILSHDVFLLYAV